MRGEMRKVAQRYLRAMSIVFIAFYVIRGVSYLITYDPDIAGLLGWPALATAGFGAAVYWATKKYTLAVVVIEVLFVVIGFCLIFNVIWNYHLTADQPILVNTAFILIAAGLGTTRVTVWISQITMVLLVFWWAVGFFAIEIPSNYLIVLVSGTLLSFLAFLARVPMMRERVRLEVEMMRQAVKLERANEAKDHFVANMTHELRTPLTGVMGMMELMQDTKLDGEQRFMLQNARKSAQLLLNVVNDILDFSKLEAGKLALKPAPTDIISVCKDAVAVFEAQASDKKLALNLTLPDHGSLPVVADSVRIGQVLMNLISNALKFTLKGGVDVSLEWLPAKGGGYAKFSVTDTGIGIAAEEAAMLFHRFEQVDSSATRTTTGTGLGLAICQELVTLMGGNIGVTSELDTGSSFSFQIYLETTDNYDEAPVMVDVSLPEREAPKSEQNDGKAAPARRALLAEDNAINRTLIARMIELEGFELTTVENGEEAVRAVDDATEPFDVIFMDIQMPIMDGVSATRIIRLRKKNPPPIVAVTANTREQDLKDYEEAGIVHVLGKPLKQDVLRELIAKLFP